MKSVEKTLKQFQYYFIFMGPAILLFTILFIIPFIGEIYYSFTNWNGIDNFYEIIGINNYLRTFEDDAYWRAMWFTISFSALSVIFSNLIAFCWAYILSKPVPFRNFWRAIIFLPRIIGGVVLGYLWRFIFQNAFVQFGEATNISWFAQNWFSTPESSFYALVIVFTWTLSGYLMLIYSAGFAAIPGELSEAAVVDGASSFQILKNIIIPMIMPSITQCLFIAINWTMLLYDTNISLTNGNPYRSSEGVTMNIYATAYRTNQIGYGAAKSCIFILIIVAITMVQIYITSRREVEL
jgi:raffinose/stachyose/melibiose transport system permease protein